MKTILVVFAVVPLLVVGLGDGPDGPAPISSRPQPEIRAHHLDVSAVADIGKPDGLRSVMGQWVLSQDPNTSGPSPDSLRFVFDADARIHGVLISVDIAGPQLVEVAAGINTPNPYGITNAGTAEHRDLVARDWLIHTSDANGGQPSRIDEHVWFPVPFLVEAGDYIAVDAWITNQTTRHLGISPEVIIYYEWISG